ncbi:hypothetical protein JHL18_04685 [Clostridium sp. YIM B02505]|uniref:DUF3899 domain-containing protein n=1 Tax=Clostridium yunnanense TaxID=2800325 RepID=A0ABS1EKR6_9CLOT|nr:hypothetical protein [Clostridium yunnanense]MBK1809937.1 hypothetical protein [Clostridium yunnanense]
MLIWKGYGFLAFLFFLTSFLIVELAVGETFYRAHRWLDFFAFVITALFCYFVGKKLNNNKGKVYIDKKTGEEVLIKTTHSLFFIKMEYWGFIFLVIGFIYLFLYLQVDKLIH